MSPDEMELPQEALREVRSRVVAGKHPRHQVTGLIVGVGEVLGGTVFDSLAWAVRDMRARRRLRQLIEVAGPAVRIAEADASIVRIEGRVDVLEPPMSKYPDVAAFLIQRASDGACGCQRECKAVRRSVGFYDGAGRFTVEDESGVALVLGPHFHLVDYHGRRPDPFEAGSLVVRRGDLVTIIGPASRKQVAGDPRLRGAEGGYRGLRSSLVFECTKDQPVHVFLPAEEI